VQRETRPLHIASAKSIGVGRGYQISTRGRSGMTRPEFLKGFAIFAIIIGAAWLSMPYVDRYVLAVSPVKAAIPETPQTADAPPVTCVQSDGSYKNWPWPNVPTLSPPCVPEK
jgi:hypothetical protein